MDNNWIIKLIVYLFMLGIVFALGSGLYFILRHKGKPEDAVKALTVRISLSLILFFLLFLAFALGWIHPHEVFPRHM